MEKARRLPLAKPVLLGFFCYCGIEASTNLWAASYLTGLRGVSAQTAAQWTSLFFLGITAGRLVTGFATIKFQARTLMRVGQGCCLAGILFLLLPLPNVFAALGLALIGLGCAPLYPCMLHETPRRFGEGAAQSLMGLQMASAYLGSTLVPPLIGLLAPALSLWVLPAVMLVLLLMMTAACERVNLACPTK